MRSTSGHTNQRPPMRCSSAGGSCKGTQGSVGRLAPPCVYHGLWCRPRAGLRGQVVPVSKRTDDLERRVKRACETAEHLLAPWAGKGTPSVLFEFMRRGEQPFGADGYASRSALDPSGVGGGSSDMTSVESAANSRMQDVCSAARVRASSKVAPSARHVEGV